MNKNKIAKLFTFAMIVGGATAIYLYFSKNKKQQPPPPKKKTGKVYMGGFVNTKSSDLNIRKEPNTTSDIVGKLKNGAIVTILDSGIDGWYKLVDNINQKPIGYVSAQYISIEDKNKIEP